jgi:hypothetical protein
MSITVQGDSCSSILRDLHPLVTQFFPTTTTTVYYRIRCTEYIACIFASTSRLTIPYSANHTSECLAGLGRCHLWAAPPPPRKLHNLAGRAVRQELLY